MILHPKLLSKPFTVGDAINNPSIINSDKLYLLLTGKTSILIKLAKQGESLCDVHKKATGKNAYFDFIRLHPSQVSPTVLKRSAGLIHPTENRTLTIGEYKRISSFPDRFILKGSFNKCLEIMGNSVLPYL